MFLTVKKEYVTLPTRMSLSFKENDIKAMLSAVILIYKFFPARGNSYSVL